MTLEQQTVVLKENVFEYLDAVQDSGLADMFDTVPSLEAEYGLINQEAMALLAEWMVTFDERHPQG